MDSRTIATRFSTPLSYSGTWWAVERNGKVIAHIRPCDDLGSKWSVHRVDRSGMSGQYPTPQQAARAYGLRIDEWRKEDGSKDRERLETEKPAMTERKMMEAMSAALGTRSPYG